MPNWCYNRIRVDADSDQVEQLKEIHAIFDNHSDPFNQLLPIPDFKNIPNEKGELPIKEEVKKEIKDYVRDHYKYYGWYPYDVEVGDVVYTYEQYMDILSMTL